MADGEAPIHNLSSPNGSGSQLRRRYVPSAKKPNSQFQSNRMLLGPDGNNNGGGISASNSRISNTSMRGLTGVRVSSEEADAILQELANKDDHSKKTWSRVFVERYLSKYDWYWPRRNDPDAPDLKKAWCYYEYVTLPRHCVGDEQADTVMRRAEPGEHESETELFDPFRLKQSHLTEWGTGMDLYFISLKFFAFVLLVCGLINITSIYYYAVGDYNAGGEPREFDAPLKASAICTNREWVVCTDCAQAAWADDPGRFVTATGPNGNLVNLVSRNLCEGAELQNGVTNFITLLFVLVAVGIFSYYMELREIRFDEDRVTTTDYSIVVKNPPPDCLEPDTWNDFFSQFATDGDQVTFVTVALNNDKMVRKLLTRRKFANQLRLKLPQGLDMDNKDEVTVAVDQYNTTKEELNQGCIGKLMACFIVPPLNLINMLLPPDDLIKKIDQLTAEIKVLQEETYNATQVYITFETENGQRTALDAMKVGYIDLFLNRTHAIPAECVFQDRVLHVVQPTEPNAVRWLDLSYTMVSKMIRRMIALSVTLGMIAVAGFLISKARSGPGVFVSGPLTTAFNTSVPQVIKILMSIEPHQTEGAYQASLYLKITLFRWSLTAILTQFITPFTSTLGSEPQDVLYTIYAILLSEVWMSPLLRLSDWYTNFKKHILAPRAKTQEEMNMNFQGTYYHMGDRYTDFTKILFVVFYYSALFPAGFFFGFVILTFQYVIDKFSLVRIWGWTPQLGNELAVFSRRFFFTGAMLALAIVSSYSWAQFPYDNLCDPNEPQIWFSGLYTGAIDASGEPFPGVNNDGVVIVRIDSNAVFCDQSWRGYKGFSFPPTPGLQSEGSWLSSRPEKDDVTWMSESQSIFTRVYGWFAFGVTVAFIIALFGRSTYLFVLSFFKGTYRAEGEDQHIDFSSNPEIFAYIPQVKLVGQPFPYLCCDIDDIDQGLIGWNNPAHSYDYYNLMFDVPHKSLRRTKVIEENTRGTTTIAEHEEYEDHDENPLFTAKSAGAGYEVNERQSLARPIFSVVQHYPTKWQMMLAEKEEAASQAMST